MAKRSLSAILPMFKRLTCMIKTPPNDAEQKQLEDEAVKKTWLKELQDLPYDAKAEKDKANILELVLRHEPDDANFGVIPIVGTGGIGKTTLAQEVYNDVAVKEFTPKAWVSFSDNAMKISKSILECITSNPCDVEELNVVQNLLRDALNGKKFLIVLNDVGAMSHRLWEILKAPFVVGAPGSKIIVTIDIIKGATAMRAHLLYLSRPFEDNCRTTFVAPEVSRTRTDSYVNKYREEVSQLCEEVTIATEALGGLLYYKETADKWLNIFNLLSSLRRDYDWLASDLRECFAYCSLFPKGYEFGEEELVSQWMAKGLIQPSNNDLQLEDLGGQYFHDLLSRSFFTRISSGDTSKFVMNDIVKDFARMTCVDIFNSKKWDGGIGDDNNNGGDDDNTGSGGGKNNKKGNHRDGDGNADKDKRGHDHGGGEMKGKDMKPRGKAVFHINCGRHAENENGYPIGQLQCIR